MPARTQPDAVTWPLTPSVVEGIQRNFERLFKDQRRSSDDLVVAEETLPATPFVVGDLFYASSTEAMGRLAAVASGQVLVSAGVAIAPAWSATPTVTSLTLGAAGALAWSTDLFLYREAANVLAQRNGTNNQDFLVYNTYTDGSNYERGGLIWSANELFVGTQNAGSGTARSLVLMAGNAGGWKVDLNRHFLAYSDNAYDIGAAGANRPRDVYIARDLFIGDDLTVNDQLEMGGHIIFTTDNAKDIGALAATRPRTVYVGSEFNGPALYNRASAGVLQMGTIAADGGSVEFFTRNTQRWQIGASTGHLIAFADNSYDLGASGANRPRNGYFAGTLSFGTHSVLLLEALSGYITITDSGGTTRKIGVIS